MSSGEAIIALLLAVTMVAVIVISAALMRQQVAAVSLQQERIAAESRRAEYWQSKAIAALLCDARLRAQLESEGMKPSCNPPGLNSNDVEIVPDVMVGILETMFTLEELEALCFDVGINYDDLGGHVGLEVKVARLISYARRRGLEKQLRDAIQKARPNARLN